MQVFKTSRVLWFLEQLEMFKEVRRWNLHKNVEVNVLSSEFLQVHARRQAIESGVQYRRVCALPRSVEGCRFV